MAFSGGGNGQWVRTRNKRGAKAFLAEQQADAERHGDDYRRSIAFRRRLRSRARGWVKSLRR